MVTEKRGRGPGIANGARSREYYRRNRARASSLGGRDLTHDELGMILTSRSSQDDHTETEK